MPTCSSCGLEVKAHWTECPKCEAVLAKKCPSCGEAVGADWKKCPECSAPLTGGGDAKSSASAAPSEPKASQSASAPAATKTDESASGTGLGRGFGDEQFALIESGRFEMGSVVDAENPPHDVRVSNAFWMQKTPVTQAQWMEIMGDNPSHFTGDDLRPVEQVSWEDVQAFLTALDKKTGQRFRLPTDAEWEYAFRAGAPSAPPVTLDAVAWYKNNSGGTTHPVGTLAPNAWGLHDVHGNVSEWVSDWYVPLEAGRVVDPKGPSYGLTRVLRNGSWFNNALIVRSAPRGSLEPKSGTNKIGFRIARNA